jgi:hypothetical protein
MKTSPLTLAGLKGLRRLLAGRQAALRHMRQPADAAIKGHKGAKVLHPRHHAVAAPAGHRVLHGNAQPE